MRIKVKSMLTNSFLQAAEIIDVLEQNGNEAYFVGGCVRDLLLGRDVQDIDIATSASPDEVQILFDKVIPVGIEHGTVIVRNNGVSYEVTTFRQDGTYTDQRHPDKVTYVTNIEEDLKRRDFTINALAMDKHGEIIDLFAGKADIQKKQIRSVGNAHDRFLEDPLRIVRALRFSSQLGFTIEKHTLAQMKKLNKEIATVAVERLTNEFTSLLQGDFVHIGIDYFIEIEGYRYVPIFKDHHYLINKLPIPLTPFYSFAEIIALFQYLHPEIKIVEWVKAWKCSNRTKNEAINLSEALMYYHDKGIDDWLIYRLNRSYIHSFVHLIELLFKEKNLCVENLLAAKDAIIIQSKKDLQINGRDLLELFPGIKQGPWMKEMIEQIEFNVVTNQLENNKQVIKEWILCHPPEVN